MLVKLFRGHTFGETALESKGGLRSAGAMASQPTNLIALHVDAYQSIMANFNSSLKGEVADVLALCPVFKDWERDAIDHLATAAVTRHYSANSSILKEGEKIKYLYIVKTGVVQITKNIEKPASTASLRRANTFSNLDSDNSKEAPGNWVLETNWKNRLEADSCAKQDPKTFVTAFIGSGQVFGELAILDPEVRSPTCAIAYTNLELYGFESDILLTLGSRFNATTINSLNESMNLANPPSEKIAFYFRYKIEWEKNKAKILKKVKSGSLGKHV